MTEAAHAPYRRRLAQLADDASVLNPLIAAGFKGLAESRWVRRFARFEPWQSPFAVLVFERVSDPRCVLRLEVFERKESATDVQAALGWLRLEPFTTDPCLPSLPAVVATPGRWSVARYLPYRRCTLRLETCAGRRQFVKVYADDRGSRAHAVGRLVWDAAGRGELAFRVPEPDHWDRSTHSLWQVGLEGAPVAAVLYGPHGTHVAQRIGHALSSLICSTLEPPRERNATHVFAESVDVAAQLIRRVPSLAASVRGLLNRLADEHARFTPREPRPIHGDPHADQWLDNSRLLGLVDFEALAWGDPELDAAIFLAELDFEDQLELPVAQLEAAFLAGLRSGGRCLDPARLVAYRAHKRLAKALRSARAVRADGDERASAHLARALDCFSR